MGTHHPNHRRVKHHRTYSVRELTALFGMHPNTVRNWKREGLEPVDGSRPILFHGKTVADFLAKRRQKNKAPCGPGRLYCLPCRKPQVPAGGMVDYGPSTATSGSLSGICPACNRMMFRRVALARLGEVAGSLEVQISEHQPRLREGQHPSVKCDFVTGEQTA
jgi:hypothetical protein